MISQIGIVFFGVLAAWLTQQANESRKKYACIFGLISQPFWFYSAIETNQWGIFLLSIIYTVVWLIGFKNYWFKKVIQDTEKNHQQLNRHENWCSCRKPKVKTEKLCFDCQIDSDFFRDFGYGPNGEVMPEVMGKESKKEK